MFYFFFIFLLKYCKRDLEFKVKVMELYSEDFRRYKGCNQKKKKHFLVLAAL